MDNYKVLVSAKAVDDMENIYTYIAETLMAPETAAKQYDKIAAQIMSLEMMPMRVKLMDSEPEKAKGLRLLPVGNYNIIFAVAERTVTIVRVLYSRVDIGNKLTE